MSRKSNDYHTLVFLLALASIPSVSIERRKTKYGNVSMNTSDTTSKISEGVCMHLCMYASCLPLPTYADIDQCSMHLYQSSISIFF